MNNSNYLLTLNLNSDQAVEQVSQRLINDGFQIVRSFNLQIARSAHSSCTCPYHRTERCDCQMIVLLVYNHGGQPLTLIAHGKDGKTHFELLDSPQHRSQHSQRLIQTAILQTLALVGFAVIRQPKPFQAP